jgi:UDP-GlcNAc:undecaprenyl-phosphate GlcNAc-1-phosphate transferase
MVNKSALFLSILFPVLIALGITPLVIKIYKKFKILDDPTKSKHPKILHKYPVPRGGGIVIFLSILVPALILLPIDKHLIGILLGLFVLLIAGVLDDVYSPHPLLRLMLMFIAALVVVASGIGIPYISNPFNGVLHLNSPQIPIFLFGKLRTIWILADIFAIIWIISLANFSNWSSGLDGQLAGIMIVASFIIGVFSLRFSADITQWPVIILALITAGSYLGFLFFNFYPQKIMTGFGGGTMGGYMLAVLSILATTKVGTITFVLAIPLIDAFYTIIRRVLAKKSPFWGDAGHLHHKLIQLGWGKRRIAIIYWTITAILGLLALNLNARGKFITIIILSILILFFLLWIKLSTTSSKALGRGK